MADDSPKTTRLLPRAYLPISLGEQGRQPGSPSTRGLRSLVAPVNIYDGGYAVIEGITTIENVPGSRKVRLFDRRSGRLVQEVWSNSAGQYRFTNIDNVRDYFVIAHDHTGQYNGVIADRINPSQVTK